MNKILPVILSGGNGTRLWPLSRQSKPKQFLNLMNDDKSMFQHALLRVADVTLFEKPLIISNQDHRFLIVEQLDALGVQADICLEPSQKNTAPAVIVAALKAKAKNIPYILVLPSDHAIDSVPDFIADVKKALALAVKNSMVLFGIKPATPNTGYGYIEQDLINNSVKSFIEKPDSEKAKILIKDPAMLWNAGIFLLPVEAFLNEVSQYAAQTVSLCASAIAEGEDDLGFFRLDANAYNEVQPAAIDRLFFEKTKSASVVQASFGWSDLGAWDSVAALQSEAGNGNKLQGAVLANNTNNSFIRSDGPLVAVNGLDDVVVVAAKDAVLVSSKAQLQSVGKLVEKLMAEGRYEAVSHAVMYRPWGHFEELYEAPFCKVIRIYIKPKGRLTLQSHAARSEHWVVINGRLDVSLDGQLHVLSQGQSVFAGPDIVHRLENTSDMPVEFIEVQIGADLTYEGVTRLDEVYG